jgi:hypothetical protein
MEGRAYINCLAGNFSERASLQGWRVTRRSIRAESWYFSREAVTVQGGYGACFCRHSTNYIACWRDRGTILVGAANLSPVTNLVACTGAVSRYKFCRSRKTVTMQELFCRQVSVSGCNIHYKFV